MSELSSRRFLPETTSQYPSTLDILETTPTNAVAIEAIRSTVQQGVLIFVIALSLGASLKYAYEKIFEPTVSSQKTAQPLHK